MQIHVVNHPLKEGQVVRANRPSCQCRGAKIESVQGTIKKVITNHAGVWYYLGDVGITVKGEWVQEVIK